MQAPAGDAADGGYMYTSSFGDPGDGIWWYSLAKADGGGLQIFLSTMTSCDSCNPLPEPVGGSCSPVPEGGVSAVWDGTAITGQSTCHSAEDGGTETVACDSTECMPAGRYVVKMCAGCLEDGPEAGTTCISVPFDYPTKSDVVGELPP